MRRQFVDHTDIYCKSKCGFYGNSEWDGYCSKCYKEFSQFHGSIADSHHDPNSGFHRFEEKRKHKTMRNITLFKKPSAKDAFTSDTWPRRKPLSGDVSNELSECFHSIGAPPALARDIIIRVSAFVDRASKLADKTDITDFSDMVQGFYQKVAEKLSDDPAFTDCSSEQIDTLIDGIERFIMTRLYKQVFQAISSHNEEKDLQIQNRIRSLNWVSGVHLDCGIKETHPAVRDNLDKAITDILEMDNCSAPQDKLNCIVRCCETIFSIMKVSQGYTTVETQTAGYSADEFLPALIYLILKANPPRLHSNISYISRFCNQNKLMSGEGGYYFTSLCCAVSYTENICAESLGLTEEEFDRYMRGDALPPGGLWEQGLWTSQCEGIRLTTQNLAALAELRERQERLCDQARNLRKEMAEFKEQITCTVNEALEKYPWTLKPRKIPTDLDSNDPECDLLPSPLQPQIVGGLLEETFPVLEDDAKDLKEPVRTSETITEKTVNLFELKEPDDLPSHDIPNTNPDLEESIKQYQPESPEVATPKHPEASQEVIEAKRNLDFVQSLTSTNSLSVCSGHRRIPSIPCETGTISPFSPTSYSPRDELPEGTISTEKQQGDVSLQTPATPKNTSSTEDKVVRVLSEIFATFDGI